MAQFQIRLHVEDAERGQCLRGAKADRASIPVPPRTCLGQSAIAHRATTRCNIPPLCGTHRRQQWSLAIGCRHGSFGLEARTIALVVSHFHARHRKAPSNLLGAFRFQIAT